MNDEVRPSVPVGYLARLVERVAPTEPTLRRRQPALFESAHPALVEPVAEPVGTGMLRRDAAPVLAELAVAPRPTHTVPAPVRTPAQLPSRPPQDEQPSANARATTVPHEAPRVDSTIRIMRDGALARPVPARSPTAFAPTPTALRPASPPPAPPDAARARRRPALERETVVPPRRAAEPPAVAPVAHKRPVARADTVTTPAPPKSTAAPAAPAATPPRPPPPPAFAPRNTARRQAATALQPAPRPAVRELPPIEVTIGRIEVRAVAGAPGAPRGTPNATPRLSLDEYLRDRGGSR